MANAEKLLRALLAKAYKKQDTEIANILADTTDDTAGENLVTAWDAERVTEITKPKPGTTFQDGYAKAKGEVLTQLEKDLKAKYNIESDAKGIDLISEVISAQPGNKSNLTDDEVRKHPIYQQFEKDMRKQLKDKDAEIVSKVSEVETKYKKDQVFNDASKSILTTLDGLKPVLPKSPEVAATWRANFLNEFKGFDFEKQADGRFLVMKDGQVQTNAHGHSLYVEDLVKDTAGKYFEFEQNNGGANPGGGTGGGDNNNNNGGGGATYPAGITKPKTSDELFKIVNDLTIKAEDRATVLQTWEAEQSGQK